MRIFVLGNISSGKSYLIEKLKKVLPNYKILKIDEYRINNCDGSLESELKMWNEFPHEVLKYNDVIIELTGAGDIANNVIDSLEENSFLVLKVNTNVNKCIERSKDKDFSHIPYPKEFNQPIEETIKQLGEKFSNGSIDSSWSKALNIIEVQNDIDIDKIPLMQYHLLFKVKEELDKYRGSLFLFGSAGRGKMSDTSDVDIYFLTDTGKEEIFDKLQQIFHEARMMANEIIIRENGILLELYCISNIEEAHLFYNRSLISKPAKTILKDDLNITTKLEEMAEEEFDKIAEIKFTMERLSYYVESLPTLIKKNDEYKYYFHNNIIVHEFVKLRAFLKGMFDFSYLPLQAKQYLTDDEWTNIFYMFGDDMVQHYEMVRIMSTKLIDQVKKEYDLRQSDMDSRKS